MKSKPQKILVLDNIRSVLNVGAIFRTADAIGINKIFLVGITPAPIDRFGRLRQDLHKAALGAEKNIKWQQFENSKDTIEELNRLNSEIISIEQDAKAFDYKKVAEKINKKASQKNIAIVLGNEVEGVSVEFLKASDQIAEIKMQGKKESLNVSVTAGIVLFRFFDK